MATGFYDNPPSKRVLGFPVQPFICHHGRRFYSKTVILGPCIIGWVDSNRSGAHA
jgi:hypothetical protein